MKLPAHSTATIWTAIIGCLSSLLLGCAGGGATQIEVEVTLPEPMNLQTERVEVFLVQSCGPEHVDPGKKPSEWLASVYTLRDDTLDSLDSSDGGFMPGQYGLYAVAQDGDCAVVAQRCIELELNSEAQDPVIIELEPWSGTGCSDGVSCSLETGQCPEPVTDCSVAKEGRSCLLEDVAGLCRQGKCCTGCWTGSACATGDEATRCGIGGGLCQLCECQSDLCVEGACSPTPAYAKVSAGETHSCAIADTGELWCWGSSRNGELGIGEEQGDSCGGNNRCKMTPAQVSFELDGSIARWSELSAGREATCATLASDSSLWCWGSNESGRMGAAQGVSESRVPFQVSAGSFTHLEIEERSGCVIASDRSLWCWGYNEYGQANPSAPGTTQYEPVKLQLASDWIDVALGYQHACAVRENGDLWCWGYNANGQVGNGKKGDGATPPKLIDPAASSVAAFQNASCGTLDGELLCWGENLQGQLGVGERGGDNGDIASPTAVAGDLAFAQVSGGESFACGITDSGKLFCWGQNNYEQLGIGVDASDVAKVYQPEQVGSRSDWISVSAGGRHACAIQRDGTLWCWGDNSLAQLGLGYRNERPNMPTRVCF